ncbi:Fic family protein [Pseudoscardovia radai]|uniref:Fic family protein n=1 Tax=Pseudoscardovia radai TaxID=987066 RepID=UPI00399534C1
MGSHHNTDDADVLDNWRIGSGLQGVDGLTTSASACNIAHRYADGLIEEDQAEQEIRAWHASHPDCPDNQDADIVAFRICSLLTSDADHIVGPHSTSLSPAMLAAIHRRLFTGVLPTTWTGRWRTQNIRKSEPVLGGDTVAYSAWDWIEPTLNYDFSEETRRRASYARMDPRDVAAYVRGFVAGVWQIHPFREGNTRTVMTLAVLYLRDLGFRISPAPFDHSQFLRDALVLANAPSAGNHDANDHAPDAPLTRFWNTMLFDADDPLTSLRGE